MSARFGAFAWIARCVLLAGSVRLAHERMHDTDATIVVSKNNMSALKHQNGFPFSRLKKSVRNNRDTAYCWTSACTGLQSCSLCLLNDVGMLAGPLKTNGLPLSYAKDMLPLAQAGATYAKSWCNDKLAGCKVKNDFPGLGTTSYMGWQQVWDMGKQLPQLEWSGKVWRGNSLGIIIYNPYFFSTSGIYPYAIALGITPTQHAAIRPTMEQAWNVKDRNTLAAFLHKSCVAFLRERAKEGTLLFPKDMVAWVHIVLYEIAFEKKKTYSETLEFVEVMNKLKIFGVTAQLMPKTLYRSQLSPVRDKVAAYTKGFEADVERIYGHHYKGKDCSPSKSCSIQASAGMFDALALAGGLSVPTSLSVGTGILYSTHATNPFKTGNYPSTSDGARQFFWECVRWSPPVVGFGRWDKRPTCPGMTASETQKLQAPDGKSKPCPKGRTHVRNDLSEHNQYIGGRLSMPMLALAQHDPEKWGANAREFHLRSLKDYEDYGGVGYAQMSKDPTLQKGNMNRNCPGQSLSLLIGEIFFHVFNKDGWQTASPENITFGGTSASYITEFELTPVSGSQPVRHEEFKSPKISSAQSRDDRGVPPKPSRPTQGRSSPSNKKPNGTYARS